MYLLCIFYGSLGHLWGIFMVDKGKKGGFLRPPEGVAFLIGMHFAYMVRLGD